MTCIRMRGMIVCISPFYRLRLLDGRYVFMEWHRYLGPTLYKDKHCRKEITEWYKDELMCRAVEWFQARGCRA
jgi:hypothetical protein